MFRYITFQSRQQHLGNSMVFPVGPNAQEGDFRGFTTLTFSTSGALSGLAGLAGSSSLTFVGTAIAETEFIAGSTTLTFAASGDLIEVSLMSASISMSFDDEADVFEGFKDNFERANASLEDSIDASGGGQWIHDTLIDDALQIVSGNLRSNTVNSTGSAYSVGDLGTLDQYVEYVAGPTTNSAGTFFALRMTDRSNFVGIRSGNGTTANQVEVYRRVGGTLSALHTSAGGVVTEGDRVRLEVLGSNWAYYVNDFFRAGGAIGATFSSTEAGVVARNATNNNLCSSIRYGGLQNMAFKDNFNRADANLAGTGGWTVSGSATSAQVRNNMLGVFGQSISTGVTLCPDKGYADHYVQFRIKDLGSTSTASFILIKSDTSGDNFIGIRVNDTVLTDGIEVYKRIAGTFTPLWTGGLAVSADDVLRLTAVGDSFEVHVNGVSVHKAAHTAPELDGFTRCGVISRAGEDQNPWIDDFEHGAAVALTPDPPSPYGVEFTDDFETDLSNWTLTPAATFDISSGSIRAPTQGDEAPRRAVVTTPISSPDLYVKAELATVGWETIYLAGRVIDTGNFVGVRIQSANISLLQRTTGAGFETISFVVLDDAPVAGDIMELRIVGNQASVHLNDVEIIAAAEISSVFDAATSVGIVDTSGETNLVLASSFEAGTYGV